MGAEIKDALTRAGQGWQQIKRLWKAVGMITDGGADVVLVETINENVETGPILIGEAVTFNLDSTIATRYRKLCHFNRFAHCANAESRSVVVAIRPSPL